MGDQTKSDSSTDAENAQTRQRSQPSSETQSQRRRERTGSAPGGAPWQKTDEQRAMEQGRERIAKMLRKRQGEDVDVPERETSGHDTESLKREQSPVNELAHVRQQNSIQIHRLPEDAGVTRTIDDLKDEHDIDGYELDPLHAVVWMREHAVASKKPINDIDELRSYFRDSTGEEDAKGITSVFERPNGTRYYTVKYDDERYFTLVAQPINPDAEEESDNGMLLQTMLTDSDEFLSTEREARATVETDAELVLGDEL